ncbi:MAG: phosphate-selective porin OprO/OprP [Crocinitomicaceae bacterium]|jgi:phosphate-selective porin OprO/OprP
MMNKIVVTSLLVLLTGFSFSQRKIDSKFGKGLYNVIAADSSWSMKFGMRFQTLFVGEWNVNDSTGFGVGTSEFLIRRARLKFDGFAGHPRLKYKLELGLSNKDLGKADSRTNYAPRMILDAVLKWNFYQNFELWAGQTKLPGNRERVVSSANLQFVDRSQLNSNFNIDRDIGMQLRHKIKLGENFIIKEIVSVAQGEGRNLVQDNLGGYQYTGRIELLPFGEFASKGDYVGADTKREQKPKLAIGASYDWNDRAVKDKSNQGSYMSYDTNLDGDIDGYFHSNISTIFVDLMFKYKGFSVMGEYAKRNALEEDIQQTIVNDDLSTTTKTVFVGEGLNVQLGYVFNNNWEVAARYTGINPETVTGKSAVTQYTFGVSKYVVGHKLKVQTDVSYLTTEGSDNNGLMYRLQFDIHF